MKKQSFVFGAVILALSGIVCKLLGAIYKIPLTNILGAKGVGIYYLIFPIYAFLLTLTSSSFTISISKSISKALAKDDKVEVYSIFKTSLFLLSILGILAGILLSLFSRLIASLQGLEMAFICYLVVAPSILFTSISCAFKGYFQGLQNMLPTAISQIIEQVIKLSSGFLLSSILIKKGILYGALGALIGVSISEVISCLFFIIYYYFSKNKIVIKKVKFNLFKKSFEMLKQTFPFMLSSIILPMSMVIDSFLIVNILKSMNFDKLFATSLLGINSGIVNTLISLPSTLLVAICMTIVPYITFALSKKDYNSINEKTAFAIKLTIIISIPCVFVFIFFSPQIIKVLYSSSFESLYEFNLTSTLLSVSSINILYLGFLQISTSLLQAINKAYIPVISLSISLIFKVFVEVLFINIPYLNITGAIISNSVCYLISSCINIYYFKKSVNFKLSFYKTIISPLISSLIMIIIIYISNLILINSVSYVLCVLLSFLFGGVCYLSLIFILKTFTLKEQKSFLFFNKFKRVEKS